MSRYLAFRLIAQYFVIFVLCICIYIYIFSKIQFSFQKQFLVSLLTKSKRRVFGVASVPKCNFNRVTMQFCWSQTFKWVFCEFATYIQGTSLLEDLNLSFAKAFLCLIFPSKGTFTYFYHCFVHALQIFWHFNFFINYCNSSYICVTGVHNLKLCSFFLLIIEYNLNQTSFSSFEVSNFKIPLKL